MQIRNGGQEIKISLICSAGSTNKAEGKPGVHHLRFAAAVPGYYLGSLNYLADTHTRRSDHNTRSALSRSVRVIKCTKIILLQMDNKRPNAAKLTSKLSYVHRTFVQSRRLPAKHRNYKVL